MRHISYTVRCGKCNNLLMNPTTCPRCKNKVYFSSDAMSGPCPWYCENCHEMLSRDGTIPCDSCGHRNLIRIVYEMSGNITTLTSFYREALLLNLSGLQLRARMNEADKIEKERIGLENALATLDMGFDLDRFVEVFAPAPVAISEYTLRLQGIPFSFLRHTSPNEYEGGKTVELVVCPEQRRLDVFIGVRNSMNEFFMNDIILESFSYFTDIEADMPQVTINGNVWGLQVRVTVSKQSMEIRCAKNWDSEFGKAGDSFHYLLQLEPLKEQEPASEKKLYLPYIRK